MSTNQSSIASLASSFKQKFFDSQVGTLVDMIRDPVGLFERRRQRHGDLFSLHLLGMSEIHVCSEPEAVKQVVMGSYDQFERFTGGLELFFGPESIVQLQEEAHRVRRKLMNPSFNVESVRAYGKTMLAITDQVLAELRPGQQLPLLGKMQDITLRVIVHCIFGLTEGPRYDELRRLLGEYLPLAFAPDLVVLGSLLGRCEVQQMIARAAQRVRDLPASQPFTPSSLPFRKVADRLGRIYAILDAEIERCVAEGPETRKDVAALLLQARFEDGQPMSRHELAEQLLILLIGGYETTSLSLCWAVYGLLRNKDVLVRVQQELKTVMGEGAFDPARVRELHYLGAVIQESMRLYPIALGVSRRLKHPLRVADRVLDPGKLVLVSTYLTQRNPALWKDPERFLPERMLERKAPPHHLFPFGTGVWRCLGAAFAEHEMRIVLARLATQVTLDLARDDIRPLQLGIAISPSGGLPVVVRSVRPGPTAHV